MTNRKRFEYVHVVNKVFVHLPLLISDPVNDPAKGLAVDRPEYSVVARDDGGSPGLVIQQSQFTETAFVIVSVRESLSITLSLFLHENVINTSDKNTNEMK